MLKHNHAVGTGLQLLARAADYVTIEENFA